jgi:hypothetical protein
MPGMSRVELFAALRRESRAGASWRALAAKYRLSRNIVAEVLTSARPKPRKPFAAAHIAA